METIVENIPQIIAIFSIIGAAGSAMLAFWATQRERRANVGIREATAAEKQAAAWGALLESYQERVASLERNREECKREMEKNKLDFDMRVDELQREIQELQEKIKRLDDTVNGGGD